MHRIILVSSYLLASSAYAGASFSKAQKASQGPQACTGKSFLDPRLDDPSIGPQCWSCPDGYVRTLEPVTSDKACFKDGNTSFADADFKHKWLCDGDKGEFFDPRKGGECWSCPKSKPRRTAYKVTSSKACATKEVLGEKLGEASFEHKVKSCGKGAFFDPRKGGECWKCPSGYVRTAEAVTSKKACAKEAADAFKSAKLDNGFGCPAGQFFDPRGGGECWSCPKSHPFRTVNPVDGSKACASELIGIFAADTNFFCKQLVSALRAGVTEGEKGVAKLEEAIAPVMDTVKKPLEAQIDAMGDLIGDEALMNEVVAKLDVKAMTDAVLFAKAVSNAEGLRDVLLDESICEAAPQEIDKRLKKIKLPPPGLEKHFVAVWVGTTFTHSVYRASADVALTYVTNFSGDGGLYASVGLGATSSAEPFGVGVGGMLYPNTTLKDFGLSAAPGITLSIAKGKGFETLMKGKEQMLGLVGLIDGAELSWNPETPTRLPTIGISKSLFSVGGNAAALIDLAASAGWDFPILTYKDNVLQ